MLLAPGVFLRKVKFGDFSEDIYVSKYNSIENVIFAFASRLGQDPQCFVATLTDDTYVITEKVVDFPRTLEEFKEEHPNHIFGECSSELVERCNANLIPDLKFFLQNGKQYFAFPDSYKQAKNIPPNVLSNVFSAKPGSFYMNVDGVKSGFIPSGIDFVPCAKLEELLNLINGKNDPELKQIFVNDNINYDDFDLLNLPFQTYGKIIEYLNRTKTSKKQKIVKKSNAELKILAEKTKKNTENALLALKDELRRSSGKIVTSDFVSPETTRMRSEFSLKNIPIPEDEDSISSDTVSSSEE